MKKYTILAVFTVFFSVSTYSQTVTFSRGPATFTLTPCSKIKALSTIGFFMESKSFYYYGLYPLAYQVVLETATITSGSVADFEKAYNGFSYGTITIDYYLINCILYSNARTGQYSLLQFADFDLGGGVVHQNLKRIFERSIEQVDKK